MDVCVCPGSWIPPAGSQAHLQRLGKGPVASGGGALHPCRLVGRGLQLGGHRFQIGVGEWGSPEKGHARQAGPHTGHRVRPLLRRQAPRHSCHGYQLQIRPSQSCSQAKNEQNRIECRTTCHSFEPRACSRMAGCPSASPCEDTSLPTHPLRRSRSIPLLTERPLLQPRARSSLPSSSPLNRSASHHLEL